MPEDRAQYRKGDIVLVSFNPERMAETKLRPAVIVSSDEHNANLDDVLLIPLAHPADPGLESCRVYVSASSPEGIAAGLTVDSVVDCTVIATVAKTLLVRRAGRFSESTIRQIDACIMRSIGSTEPHGDQMAGVPRKPPPQDHDTGIALPLPE